jgi:DNA-binding response OmpR family regulator
MTDSKEGARKVLVVEDEPPIRTLIDSFLTTAGYVVVSTGVPAEALELARRENPDLVISDISMPEMDGYAVLRGLQADPATARVPVVFLTAHREFTERVRAFRFGAVDYITKPFSRDALLRRVERVFEDRSSRPGVDERPGDTASVSQLLQEVKKESRTGLLSLTGAGGGSHAVIDGGRIVESTLPEKGEAERASFRELDLDREQIAAPDPGPIRLPGDADRLPPIESLPEVFRTVLLADDNDLFRAFLKDVLERRGFVVYEANDGEQALEVALARRPWLIVTDVAMPRVDGVEFCRRVRSHSLVRHTPLIFLSGWDDYKDRYRGLEAGADEYLSKDTSIRELLIRIQILLKRYSDLGARSWRGPGMEGRVEVVGTPGLLQMCHLGRLTGVCSIGSGEDKAELRFKQGELVGAAVDELSGEEAVYEVLGWTEGHFSFAPGDPGPGEPLGSGFSQLLLEGCRRLDEKMRPVTREPAEPAAPRRDVE